MEKIISFYIVLIGFVFALGGKALMISNISLIGIGLILLGYIAYLISDHIDNPNQP